MFSICAMAKSPYTAALRAGNALPGGTAMLRRADMVDTDHSVGVGGDVLTHCNKCELDLWHTVMAKVDGLIRKVKCNTCKTEHMLRGEAKKAPHKRAAKLPMNVVLRVKDRVPHKPWGELIAGRDAATASTYA